jgi:hypothetical protein
MAIVKAKDTWGNNPPSVQELSNLFKFVQDQGQPIRSLGAIAREGRVSEALGGYKIAGLMPDRLRW